MFSWCFTALQHFLRSFRVWSVNLATLFQLKPARQLPVLSTILLPVTDNCPSGISRREKMAVDFFYDQISMEECAGRED